MSGGWERKKYDRFRRATATVATKALSSRPPPTLAHVDPHCAPLDGVPAGRHPEPGQALAHGGVVARVRRAGGVGSAGVDLALGRRQPDEDGGGEGREEHQPRRHGLPRERRRGNGRKEGSVALLATNWGKNKI